ncbi:hypothetical protein J6590_040094 [Homalodisca vitripennis]|nr:hypothetical protein J6590_040094 [Homalodisca vitripennis]
MSLVVEDAKRKGLLYCTIIINFGKGPRPPPAVLRHGAKSSFDAIGPSDDTEPVASAGPQHDAGLSSARPIRG